MHNSRKFGPIIATALSITIIVGAGLLSLPGISFAQAGQYGYVPWIIVSITMLPLLIIFTFFGRNYSSAGGVVGYIRSSLGNKWATISETIVLGTFTLGVPAISLIGAQYLQHSFFHASTTTISIFIISLSLIAGLIGLKVSGVVQTGIATLIVTGLAAIGGGFLYSSAPSTSELFPPIGSTELSNILHATPLILFAFTGWEMTAFLAEDMKNPKKDIPISIWSSFIIVVFLYLFIACIVSRYGENTNEWKFAPIAQMAKLWLGEIGGKWVSVIAAMLITANVVAAFISVSRALFSAGRDGILPRIFSKLNARKEPILAMALTYIIFLCVILINHLGFISVDVLLQLAGQNFFVLYLMTSIGYLTLHKGKYGAQIVGVIAITFVICMMFLFNIIGIIYCGILFFLGLWLGKQKRNF